MDYSIISTYLSYCKTHKRLSSHTLRAYKNDLKQFYHSNQKTVKGYIESLTQSNIKTSTLRRKIASLKGFYNYLVNQNLIDTNPFSHLRFQFRQEKSLPKIIPREDLKMIYHYLKNKCVEASTDYQKQKAERNLLIISLLLSTGIRVSEACHIQLQNIHLPNRTLHIVGKGKKERLIFLGDNTTFKLLKTYIARYCKASVGYLFQGINGNHPLSEQAIRLMLKDIQRHTPLKSVLSPHMFRHSFATMLLDSNIDIRYIQQLLGHSSISVTQIYTHVSQSKQREILSNHNPISSILIE